MGCALGKDGPSQEGYVPPPNSRLATLVTVMTAPATTSGQRQAPSRGAASAADFVQLVHANARRQRAAALLQALAVAVALPMA
jgi:hypothetical protein